MGDLYLIAHKVRGEAAFDVATQMQCPECNGHGDLNIADATFIDCVECDSLGYWWIIPTSGHRAYPYWHTKDPLDHWDFWEHCDADKAVMPPSIPDHYPTTSVTKGPTLAERLGLTKVVGKITRRI